MGDYGNDTNTNGVLSVGDFINGNIEIGGDTDWFKIELESKYTYQFDLFGFDSALGNLGDPLLILYAENGVEIVRNNNKPNPNPDFTLFDSQLRFQAEYAGAYFLAAQATGVGTGTYVVAAKIVDDFLGSRHTGENLNTMGTMKSGAIEEGWDRDWFELGSLAKGVRYYFNLMGDSSSSGTLKNPNLRVYDSHGRMIASDNNGGTGFDAFLAFVAPRNGTYYLSASGSGSDTGSYMISAQRVYQAASCVEAQQNLSIGSIFTPDRPGNVTRYTLYDATSDADSGRFTESGFGRAAKQLHFVHAANIGNWQFQSGNGNRVSNDEVYIRSEVEGVWGKWIRQAIQTLPDVDSDLNSGEQIALDDGVVLFSFTRSRPFYHASGDYPSFSATTYEQQEAIRKILAEVSQLTGLEFNETWNGDPAQIKIFQADLGGNEYVRSFTPDNSISGTAASDLVFDSTNPDNSTIPGTKGYYKLLQAVGKALGLNSAPLLLPQLNNNHFSVMSDNNSPHRNSYPSTFGILDVKVLQNIYGVGEANQGPTTYGLSQDAVGVANTITDSGGVDTVNASELTRPVKIRLKEGSFIEVGNGNFVQKHYVSYGTKLENGIGGKGKDILQGNSLNNVLQGGDGQDRLEGAQGDDTLDGQQGNDRYIYNLGDGNDTIQETGNGIDLLQINSPFWLNGLRRDFKFRRDGDDLLVDLQFNESNNVSQGSVRIKDMNVKSRRVETLRLVNGNGQQVGNNYSLVSIFARADSEWAKFQGTGSTDAFGEIAAAIS